MEKIFSNLNMRARKNPLLSVILLLAFCFVINLLVSSGFVLFIIYALVGLGIWQILRLSEDVIIVTEEDEKHDAVTLQLQSLSAATTSITEGEVGARIPKNLDGELGKIAENFEGLIQATQQIVSEIDVMSDSSAQASRELEIITQSTSRVMTDISATLEELTSTTVQLNNNVADISNGAKEIDTFTLSGMKQLDSLDKKMGQIRTESEAASSRINELSVAATKMEAVIGVISGIARQTNLLALNAAIEAARAGESGRGFAVVADEVRKLATSTQESLGDIQNLINLFLDASNETVKIINSNSRDIVKGTGILEETTKSFKIIAERISAMVQKVQESSEATSQIAAGSQEIASSAALQSESVNEIHTLSIALSKMSTEMKDALSNIHIGSSELELNLDEFDKAYAQISEAQKNALREEFKVENNFIIGMIARLEPNKGHRFFVESLKDVLNGHPEVVVLLAGNGSLDHELEKLVATMNLTHQVRLVGYRKDVMTILAISDLIVSTSINEGTPPRILLEAMAATKPIVSTNVIGAKAIIKNTKHGILVPYGEPQKLSEALLKMIKNPELALNFAQEARKHIEQLYHVTH